MKAGRKLEIGTTVTDPDGYQWVVVSLHDAISGSLTAALRHQQTGDRALVAVSEVITFWEIDSGAAVATPFPPTAGLLEGWDAIEKDSVKWKVRHIMEIQDGTQVDDLSAVPRPQYDPSSTTLGEREEAKAAELQDAGCNVSPRTLRRWRIKFERGGATALEHGGGTGARRSRKWKYPDALEILREQISALGDDSTKHESTIIDNTTLVLKERGLPVPSRATYYRMIDALTEGTYAFKDATTRRTNWTPKTKFTRGYAVRPGEWVQADTTRLDVLAIYPNGKVGAVELSTALDVATRSIVSWRITPASTKSSDVSLLIAGAMTPEPMRPGWAERVRATHESSPLAELVDLDERLETAAAKPVVYPEVFAVDNGKAYISEAAKHACQHLGISLMVGRYYQGSDKPMVERAFGTINTRFCEFLAGHKGRNTTQRGVDVEDKARFTLDDLHELFSWWAVSYWQRRAHEGLRSHLLPGLVHTPNQVYAAAVQVAGYAPVPLEAEDYIRLLPFKFRVVNNKGIANNNRTYDAAALAPYRKRTSTLSGQNGKWLIHYDPSDLTYVWLHDNETHQLVQAEWVYAHVVDRPFSATLWEMARTVARDNSALAPTEQNAAEVLKELLDGTRVLTPKQERAAARAAARSELAVTPLAPRTGRANSTGSSASSGDRQPHEDAFDVFDFDDDEAFG
jgi:transposase InsO family protein